MYPNIYILKIPQNCSSCSVLQNNKDHSSEVLFETLFSIFSQTVKLCLQLWGLFYMFCQLSYETQPKSTSECCCYFSSFLFLSTEPGCFLNINIFFQTLFFWGFFFNFFSLVRSLSGIVDRKMRNNPWKSQVHLRSTLRHETQTARHNQTCFWRETHATVQTWS